MAQSMMTTTMTIRRRIEGKEKEGLFEILRYGLRNVWCREVKSGWNLFSVWPPRSAKDSWN